MLLYIPLSIIPASEIYYQENYGQLGMKSPVMSEKYFERNWLSRRARAGRRGLFVIAFAFASAATASYAFASASLQVSPVLLDTPAPGAVATVNVGNQDTEPTEIQVRLFRWRQADGEEKLEETRDVVASPPIASISPGGSLTVRVICTAQTPVEPEEAYRLVIDQLPRADRAGHTLVSMLLRQVLPVFFGRPDRNPPAVTWSLAHGPHGFVLRAHNAGERRLRIAKVTIAAGSGRPIVMGGGLLGYVLGQSDMSWTLPTHGASFSPGARVTIRGDSDLGPINASASVNSRE